MRVLLLAIAFLASTEVVAKKNPRRGTPSSSSRPSSAYAASKRKPKLSYADWDNADDDNYEDDYFGLENYRTSRSSPIKDDFDGDDYSYTAKRPQQKRKSHTTQEQAAARSEGTFSGAGKGPLYDAYNQLHTLAQVRCKRDRYFFCVRTQ